MRLFCLLLFLCASRAYAFPEVGDFIRFDITTTYNGTVTVKHERQDLDSFDPIKQQFLSILTIDQDGQPTKTWKFLFDLSDLLAKEADAEKTLANCAANGGQVETDRVGTQTLKSCVVTQDIGDGEMMKAWNTPGIIWNSARQIIWSTDGTYTKDQQVLDFN